MGSDMTRPQIIRAACRRADERMADVVETADKLARRMGGTWVEIPGRRREYRRAEARRALIEAGMVETCGGMDE